jgi:ferredoxin
MSDIVSQKFVSYDAMPGWLTELGKSAAVYAPRREGQAVVYWAWSRGDALEFARRPTESAKHVLFPRCEELFGFSKQGEPENPGNRKLTLTEAAEPGPAVVFGLLPCDARGFFAFDPVYNGSGTKDYTNGPIKDPYYLKRRDRTVLIVRACKAALRTCFCNWVGGGPAATQGADVLATDVDGGLLLQAVTERGKKLLETGSLVASTAEQVKAAEAAHAAAEKSLPQASGQTPDLANAPKALLALFDNMDFWQGQSAGCLSCGTCAYLCPTCYCFNITDETNGLIGTRLRTWDTCMSPLFTLEASGHNPRTVKAVRLKNRVGHKYSYYPDLHEGRFACTGCGRCIKSCPSSIDIRAIVQNAVKEAANV